MREAWKRETFVGSQSFSCESAVKYLHVGQRKIQISPPPGEQDKSNRLPHGQQRQSNPHPMPTPRRLYIDRCIIITKKANLIKETQVFPHSISDHELIIFATLQLKKPCPKPVYITTRSFKNYIKDAFLEDISNAPWLILDTFDNVEDFRSIYASENCYPTPFIDDN